MSEETCNARMWSYDHWRCGRAPHLFGRHRFNNYTGARIPRVWRLKMLWRVWDCNQRLRSYQKPGDSQPRLMPYRQVLFPDHYEPIRLSAERAAERLAEAKAYEASLSEQDRDQS